MGDLALFFVGALFVVSARKAKLTPEGVDSPKEPQISAPNQKSD